MKKAYFILGLIAIAGMTLIGCSEDEGGTVTDNFDRKAMLANWADNIIVPGYETYASSLESLNAEAEAFTTSPTMETLTSLRAAWLEANLDWQKVAMFEIGKAESITLINYTNIYPTNT